MPRVAFSSLAPNPDWQQRWLQIKHRGDNLTLSVTPVALAAKHRSAESAETFLQTGEDADPFKTRPASSFHQHGASGSWTGCPCHCCHPHPGAGHRCARHCPSTETRSDAPAQAAPQIPALGSPSCCRRGSRQRAQHAAGTQHAAQHLLQHRVT